jgi:ribosomal protein L44E
MKVPKATKKYCPKCKKHVTVKIKRQKNKPRPKTKRGALKWGVRQYAKKLTGYGGTRKIVAKPVKKQKKVALLYACSVCNKKFYKQNPTRAKKFEQKT